MHRIEDIGIIGLGRMGSPMARHLLANGFNVSGYDPDPMAGMAAGAAGVKLTDSCAQLAERSDAIILIVGFDNQIEQAVFGENGVTAGARPGTVLLVASTVAPGYMKALADRVAPVGMTAIDIPVAGGEMAAESGKLRIFAGGDRDAVERCRPLLNTFSTRVDYLGAAGAGQTAKAINNMLLWTCLVANVEGLDLGEALGVDREALREALCHGSGANWALETRADERPALWAEKDMDLLLDEAQSAGCAMPVSQTVREAIAAFKKARGLPTPSME
ncbi:MAG: NAD(P)-dependent oxidoreductase [Alphaproteobacteria bacterium]|nr:NAD(P)-dependent oxidoreductase [Alphaproteobacteria bacterium]